MEKDLSKNIIDKIKKDHIVPYAKWKVNWKSYLFWTLLTFLILLSAIFLSLAYLSIIDFDFDLMRQMKLGRYFGLLMVSAPYLWASMLALTLFLGFQVFRKTEKGYRYSVLFMAGIIFLAVSALGVAAHMGHVNKKFGEAFANGPRSLRGLAPLGEQKFFRPEEGIIAGEIVEKNSSSLVIETLGNGEWEISYDENTRIGKPQHLEVGQAVIIVGEKTGEQKFKAFGVKPLRGPRGMGKVKGTLDAPNGLKNNGEMPPPPEGRARGKAMTR